MSSLAIRSARNLTILTRRAWLSRLQVKQVKRVGPSRDEALGVGHNVDGCQAVADVESEAVVRAVAPVELSLFKHVLERYRLLFKKVFVDGLDPKRFFSHFVMDQHCELSCEHGHAVAIRSRANREDPSGQFLLESDTPKGHSSFQVVSDVHPVRQRSLIL